MTEMIIKNNAYWINDKPICSVCKDSKNEKITMLPIDNYGSKQFTKCPKCENIQNTSGEPAKFPQEPEEPFDKFSVI